MDSATTHIDTPYISGSIKSTYSDSQQNGYCSNNNAYRTPMNIKLETGDPYYADNGKKIPHPVPYHSKEDSRPEYVSLSKTSVKQEATPDGPPRSQSYSYPQPEQTSGTLISGYHGYEPLHASGYSTPCPTQYVSHVHDSFYDRGAALIPDRQYTVMDSYQSNHNRQLQYAIPNPRGGHEGLQVSRDDC